MTNRIIERLVLSGLFAGGVVIGGAAIHQATKSDQPKTTIEATAHNQSDALLTLTIAGAAVGLTWIARKKHN